MSYQDLYRHGEILQRGERECAERWEEVRRIGAFNSCGTVSGYGRRTVVDLGAAEGYFSVRWAESSGDTVVALDPSPDLLDTAKAHPELPLIVCRKGLTPADLWEFGRCEHVDLTLCMNILHHFGPEWPYALEAVITWGNAVLFETPDPLDVGACHAVYVPGIHRGIMALPTQVFAHPASHTSPDHPRWMGLLQTPKSYLTSPYWNAPPGVQRPGAVHVYQSCGAKYGAWPRKGERREWFPGINLATYLALDGCWPSRSALAACVRSTVAALPNPHGDIRPWNWIVTGAPLNPLQLIDFGDWTSNDDDGLAWTLHVLET
jgi:hypothetical protein